VSASRSPARFVVVEGIDGAGTTTQIRLYAEHLVANGFEVHVTREPSTGPIGAFVRSLLTGSTALPSTPSADLMALLFAADRLDHVRGEIEPALARGAVVLSDRYDLSSLAYQSVAARLEGEVDVEGRLAWIRALNRHARRPDVTLVVDVDPDVAAERRRARGGAAELYETTVLQRELARAYAGAEALVPGDTVLHVAGDGSLDEVAARIREALAPVVEGGAG
jgi:dTMP kinase